VPIPGSADAVLPASPALLGSDTGTITSRQVAQLRRQAT
jgi:hypothetical protein